jgi:hypothetical protein
MENTKQLNRKGERDMQRFYKWMLKIKSIHLADNNRMSEAYQRVYINSQS